MFQLPNLYNNNNSSQTIKYHNVSREYNRLNMYNKYTTKLYKGQLSKNCQVY